MKNGRNYFVYAVLLGLAAAGGAAWYVSKAEAAANPTEFVVVAQTGIPARMTLTEDLLTIKRVPRGAVHPEASSSMEPFIGKATRQTIAPGEQVLASKLFRDRSETGAAFVLPEGRRAVAITVNELIAAGGLVLPGDKVDVIGSCLVDAKPPESASVASPSTKTSSVGRAVYALQKVEVLAVAQAIVGDEATGAQNAFRAQDAGSTLSMVRQPEAKPTARTMTLALTPEESERLVLLETYPSCALRLALRAASDDGRAPTSVLDFNPTESMDAIAKP